MTLKLHTYEMLYTPAPGSHLKEQTLKHPMTGDQDAKQWARWVVEQAGGGTAKVKLQDGSIFTAPEE